MRTACVVVDLFLALLLSNRLLHPTAAVSAA